MSSEIKPIETIYRGWRFRSRLEARWAVYFDTLGCQWQYEHEGFELGAHGRYLPDFLLTSVNMWAEVKPVPFSNAEFRKCSALVEMTGRPCILLVNSPDIVPYDVITTCNDVYCAEPCSGNESHLLESGILVTEEYLFTERRFFWTPGGGEEPWPRQVQAVQAARSARFEFGEGGR